MPIKTGGGLETITLVVTEEQAAFLRARRDSQKTPSRRVSLSDVGREVIEAGRNALTFVANTDSTPNGKEQAA
jgi:hypothetical protein